MKSTKIVTYCVLLFGSIITLLPFLLGILISLTPPQQFATTTALTWPHPITGANYLALVHHGFPRAVLVTVLMTALISLTQILCCICGAYAFAKIDFPGKKLLFFLYLIPLMIPATVTVIPLYLMMSQCGLRNTFWGLVLPYLFGSPYGVFLLRQHFQSVPDELLCAAQLDGATTLDILVHIMVPSCRPILVTLGLITVVSQWNSFLWPLIITAGPTWRVITVTTAGLQSQYNTQWTVVIAAALLAIVPLVGLFIATQRWVVRALLTTGLK